MRSPKSKYVMAARDMGGQNHRSKKRESLHEIRISLVHSARDASQWRHGLLAIASGPAVPVLEADEVGVHNQMQQAENDSSDEKSQLGCHARCCVIGLTSSSSATAQGIASGKLTG